VLPNRNGHLVLPGLESSGRADRSADASHRRVDERPSEVVDVYFVGALTSPDKTDLAFDYVRQDGRLSESRAGRRVRATAGSTGPFRVIRPLFHNRPSCRKMRGSSTPARSGVARPQSAWCADFTGFGHPVSPETATPFRVPLIVTATYRDGRASSARTGARSSSGRAISRASCRPITGRSVVPVPTSASVDGSPSVPHDPEEQFVALQATPGGRSR